MKTIYIFNRFYCKKCFQKWDGNDLWRNVSGEKESKTVEEEVFWNDERKMLLPFSIMTGVWFVFVLWFATYLNSYNIRFDPSIFCLIAVGIFGLFSLGYIGLLEVFNKIKSGKVGT